MAKIIKPLLDGFYEAFANVLVYQRNPFGQCICRKKVVHPDEPTSAHRHNRVTGWTKAVHNYLNENPAGQSLTDCIAQYALSPDSPKNVTYTDIGPGENDPAKRLIRIAWDAVTTSYNGWPLTNLSGYFVSISPDFVSFTRFPTSPLNETHYDIELGSGTWYVYVQAIDDEDHYSHQSATLMFTI